MKTLYSKKICTAYGHGIIAANAVRMWSASYLFTCDKFDLDVTHGLLAVIESNEIKTLKTQVTRHRRYTPQRRRTHLTLHLRITSYFDLYKIHSFHCKKSKNFLTQFIAAKHPKVLGG